jgi:hypothetical protein
MGNGTEQKVLNRTPILYTAITQKKYKIKYDEIKSERNELSSRIQIWGWFRIIGTTYT